jgi:hypothetical protein
VKAEACGPKRAEEAGEQQGNGPCSPQSGTYPGSQGLSLPLEKGHFLANLTLLDNCAISSPIVPSSPTSTQPSTSSSKANVVLSHLCSLWPALGSPGGLEHAAQSRTCWEGRTGWWGPAAGVHMFPQGRATEGLGKKELLVRVGVCARLWCGEYLFPMLT